MTRKQKQEIIEYQKEAFIKYKCNLPTSVDEWIEKKFSDVKTKQKSMTAEEKKWHDILTDIYPSAFPFYVTIDKETIQHHHYATYNHGKKEIMVSERSLDSFSDEKKIYKMTETYVHEYVHHLQDFLPVINKGVHTDPFYCAISILLLLAKSKYPELIKETPRRLYSLYSNKLIDEVFEALHIDISYFTPEIQLEINRLKTVKNLCDKRLTQNSLMFIGYGKDETVVYKNKIFYSDEKYISDKYGELVKVDVNKIVKDACKEGTARLFLLRQRKDDWTWPGKTVRKVYDKTEELCESKEIIFEDLITRIRSGSKDEFRSTKECRRLLGG